MGGAGAAVGAFYNDSTVRQTIKRSLQPVLDAVSEEGFIHAAVEAISSIRNLPGFGPAIATRLITLMRPDRGISVNGGSAPLLSQLTGLPGTPVALASQNNYPQLLQWVYRQPWYNIERPNNSINELLWSMRSALVDAFVYQPV